MDVTTPGQVRQRTQSLVTEYVGAVPPGRVIAIAVTTAREMWRREGSGSDFLTRWEERVLRRLTDEVAGATRGLADSLMT